MIDLLRVFFYIILVPHAVARTSTRFTPVRRAFAAWTSVSNGGEISITHPYKMASARVVGHALIEGQRRGVKYVVTTMCISGGMGAATLFKVA